MEQEQDKTCSTGLSQETSLILAYLLVWVGGIFFLKMEKKNQFVRFHAMQSTLYSLAVTAAYFLLSILAIIPLLGFFIGLIIKPILVITFWISVVFLIIKTTAGQHVRVPIFADLAELWLIRLEQR